MDQANTGPSVAIRYRLAAGDYMRASVTIGQRSWLMVAIGSFVVSASLLMMTSSVGGPLMWASLALGLSLVSGLLGLPFAWLAFRRARDKFTAEADLQADSSGVRIATRDVQSTIRWSTFRRIRELRDHFLLDFGTGAYSMVPKRAFGPEGIDTFRQLAIDAGVLDRTPAWRPFALGVVAGILWLVGLIAVTIAARDFLT